MNMRSIVLVDGAVSGLLPVDDRGLMYGDGVFRTLRMVDGQPRWWEEQIAKLTDDCARIGLVSPTLAQWQSDLELIAPVPAEGVLKLMVTRGGGPRGYVLPEPSLPRRLMLYEATPPRGPLPMPEGVAARVCSLRLGRQPRLAGIKHLNRLENVLARAEWTSPDIQEGLLLDEAGWVVSGVMSNLFVWRRNRLLTPPLDQCGVAGVARARLMRLAAAQGLCVEECAMTLPDVFEADEVMLSNSVSGLRRVVRLESKVWHEPLISPRLAELLDA